MNNSAHGKKTIDEILNGIDTIISNRDKYIGNSGQQELLLTEIVENTPENITSEKLRAETTKILEEFADTAFVLSRNLDKTQNVALDSDSDRLESALMKILKPEVQKWLDKNLYAMVKQIVSEEIKNLVFNIKRSNK